MCLIRSYTTRPGPETVDDKADEGEEKKVSAVVTRLYSTGRKSQDDTCLILYVRASSLLVVPAIFSAGQISWCVKNVAKLVPLVLKDGDNFGQSCSQGALRLSTEIVID